MWSLLTVGGVKKGQGQFLDDEGHILAESIGGYVSTGFAGKNLAAYRLRRFPVSVYVMNEAVALFYLIVSMMCKF